MTTPTDDSPVVLVTGAARRIGAQIARLQHEAGWRVLVHARHSSDEAAALVEALCVARAGSASLLIADLADPAAIAALAHDAHRIWGRLDALVNNASSYFPTPVGSIEAAQLDDLLASNLRAPLLLTQACRPHFAPGAAVVNIIDTQTPRPQPPHSAYFAAKAGLWSLTESLAVELAPQIRVNGVAPGHMMWALAGGVEGEAEQARELARIPLGRLGGAIEIARAVRFLLSDDAAYITGAILPVDGGLRLS
ncbi:SDR family oxidoreductase [Solimonas marina]|uniref:SDR family oxidoreductase n=1 Tax=Solimonas marina TaxID=2714601 RepID=A0A969W9I5_9GAMM|nr:SDR family oxidoreductase [Solimonas marina]NKF21963.1 SDR family oxidoreductase [Solimonas marina]